MAEVQRGRAELTQQLCNDFCGWRGRLVDWAAMELATTRHNLASAIVRVLEAKGVPDAKEAVEVLGAPGNGTRLFVIVPSERAKVALAEELLEITGNPHPTAGDVWILDEAQSLALIEAAGRSKASRRFPDRM